MPVSLSPSLSTGRVVVHPALAMDPAPGDRVGAGGPFAGGASAIPKLLGSTSEGPNPVHPTPAIRSHARRQQDNSFFHRGYQTRAVEVKVRQAEFKVGNEGQQLTTSGVNTCAVLIIDGKSSGQRDKNALAHVDASMSPVLIAKQITENFTPQELKSSRIIYVEGANDMISGVNQGEHAMRNIEAALRLVGLLGQKNVSFIGRLESSFHSIGVNGTGTFIDKNPLR